MKTVRDAEALGIANASADVDFGKIMARVQNVVRQVEPHDSVERYSKLGVEVIQGHARITSPWTVEVTTEHGKQTLSTRAIVIATGAAPVIPKIPGIESVKHVTSDGIWSLTEKPERLLVLGGGPIGCELAQAFAGIGCQVTLLARSGIMGKEDADAVALVEAGLAADGVQLLKGLDTVRCEIIDGEQRLIVSQNGVEQALAFDVLLCATGRKARVSGFGLEELGILLAKAGTIEVNDYLQTRYPNIYACGDVAGPYQFTHTAAHQAWYAAVNALFAGIKSFKADYRVIPWVTFTSPEVARVGLSETEAKARGIAYEVTRYGLDDLDRAIAESAAHGFVKVLTPPGKDTILGVTIVGEHAGELLAEFTLAMKHGLGLNKILGTIHPYPTWSEAAKYAAGEWKRAHAPKAALVWLERLHAWRRK
jgi:pyruvate/2-oxoglutarate dehydrogenase complex dihydrolipoamide dehydrogenase (E3) component